MFTPVLLPDAPVEFEGVVTEKAPSDSTEPLQKNAPTLSVL